MIKTLLKKQLTEIFRSYFYDTKQNKARSKRSTIVYFIFFALVMVVMLGGMFTTVAGSMCAPLVDAGMGWLYFAIMGLISILLGVFGSVFSTYSGLYLAKDNDLLLSMPIPVRSIVTARLLGVLLMGCMYSAVVIVPAVIVYLVNVPFGFQRLAGCIVMMLVVAAVVLILSCLLGWAVAKISLKLKNKSIVTVLIALAFFALYYVGYFKAMGLIQDLVLNAAVYGERVKGSAYGMYLFGRVGEGDLTAMAVFAAASVALLMLVQRLLVRSFLGIATATGKTERVKYTARIVKERSQSAAMLAKEFSRLGSSPNYMLNCALGVAFIPAAGVVMLIKGSFFAELMDAVFEAREGCAFVIVCALLCMLSSMINTAAPSVSLEGKNIWIVQSLPVDPWEPLKAKLKVQLLLASPMLLFASVSSAVAMRTGAAQSAALIVCPQLFALLLACAELSMDLKKANLNWTSEIVPIKQNMNIVLQIFGSWGLCAVLAIVYLAVELPISSAGYVAIFSAIVGAAAISLLLWLRRRGARLFSAL